jgi:hypothetical protein
MIVVEINFLLELLLKLAIKQFIQKTSMFSGTLFDNHYITIILEVSCVLYVIYNVPILLIFVKSKTEEMNGLIF